MSNDITIAIHLEVTGQEQVRTAMTQAARDVQDLGASIKAVAGEVATNTEHLFQLLSDGAKDIATADETAVGEQHKVAESVTALAEALQKASAGAKNLSTATTEAAAGTGQLGTEAEETKKHLDEVREKFKEIAESGEAVKKISEHFAPLVEKAADVSKEAETANAKLQALLQGNQRGGEAKEIGKFAEEVSKLTAMPAKVPVLESISRLTDYNVPLEQIKQLEAGMIGISRTRPGADLGTVSEAVGNAAGSGDFGQLKTWLHISDEQIAKLKELKDAGVSQGERQAYVTEVLTSQFKKLGLEGTAGLGQAQIAENSLKLATEQLGESTGAGVNTVHEIFQRLTRSIVDAANEHPRLEAIGGGIAYVGTTALSTVGGIATFIGQLGQATVTLERYLPKLGAKTGARVANVEAEKAADAEESNSKAAATQEQVALDAEKAGSAQIATQAKVAANTEASASDETAAGIKQATTDAEMAADAESATAANVAANAKITATARALAAFEAEEAAIKEQGILAYAAANNWGALTEEQAQAAQAAIANAGAQAAQGDAEIEAAGAANLDAVAQDELAGAEDVAAESAGANTIAQQAQTVATTEAGTAATVASGQLGIMGRISQLALTGVGSAGFGAVAGVTAIGIATGIVGGEILMSIGKATGAFGEEETLLDRVTSGWYRLADAILHTRNVEGQRLEENNKALNDSNEALKTRVYSEQSAGKITQQQADDIIARGELKNAQATEKADRAHAEELRKGIKFHGGWGMTNLNEARRTGTFGDVAPDPETAKKFDEAANRAHETAQRLQQQIDAKSQAAAATAGAATAPTAAPALPSTPSFNPSAYQSAAAQLGTAIQSYNSALDGNATDLDQADQATRDATEKVKTLTDQQHDLQLKIEDAQSKKDQHEVTRLEGLKQQVDEELHAAKNAENAAKQAEAQAKRLAELNKQVEDAQSKAATDIANLQENLSAKRDERAMKREERTEVNKVKAAEKAGLIDSEAANEQIQHIHDLAQIQRDKRSAELDYQKSQNEAAKYISDAQAEAAKVTGPGADQAKAKIMQRAQVQHDAALAEGALTLQNAQEELADRMSELKDSSKDLTSSVKDVIRSFLNGGKDMQQSSDALGGAAVGQTRPAWMSAAEAQQYRYAGLDLNGMPHYKGGTVNRVLSGPVEEKQPITSGLFETTADRQGLDKDYPLATVGTDLYNPVRNSNPQVNVPLEGSISQGSNGLIINLKGQYHVGYDDIMPDQQFSEKLNKHLPGAQEKQMAGWK
jgi:hypothetical protein